MKLAQFIEAPHTGPIWVMKFSADGSYLATGGQDSMVRVWLVLGSPAEIALKNKGRSKTGEDDSKENDLLDMIDQQAFMSSQKYDKLPPGLRAIVNPVPLRLYSGHKNDVTDLSWSKSNFLISSSMDKTVRLWHVSRPKCLKLFQHADCVTQCAFHPTEEKFFLSGSLDKKLRVWNIPENRVIDWAPTAQMITAVCFAPTGKLAAAGLYTGEVVFYYTEGLKYYTQIECKNHYGRDSAGRKVTGLQFAPSGKKLLITTNDSRIRVYDMEDFSQKLKFKGLMNSDLQIQASFSEDTADVICGSEDCNVYIWSTMKQELNSFSLFGGSSNGTNQSYEYFKANNSTTTVALFAPKAVVDHGKHSSLQPKREEEVSHLICVASYDGDIKFFENLRMPI